MKQSDSNDTSLLKFVVLIILILIFITIATVKIWELRIAAERVGVMHTLGSLRSAVGIQLSALVIREGTSALSKLHHSNPMVLLQQEEGVATTPFGVPSGVTPSNYLGEYPSIDSPQGEGIWYFDLDRQMLIYRVRFTDYFRTDSPNYPGVARYQLRFDYNDRNNNQIYDPGIDTPKNVSLQPIDSYHWLLEPLAVDTP